ncbi:MAG: myxococcus cysteine-rich repeat containing protein [Anaerolineae bacterium]
MNQIARRVPIGDQESCGPVAICGDGDLDPNEECDDGNTTPGDGCDAACLVECPCDYSTEVPMSPGVWGGPTTTIGPPVFETIMGESVTSCRTSNQEGSTVINVSFLNETVVGKCEVRATDISSGAQVGNPVEEIVSGLQVTACQRALVEYTTSLNNNTGVTVLFCNWPSMRTGFPNIMNASKATRLLQVGLVGKQLISVGQLVCSRLTKYRMSR